MSKTTIALEAAVAAVIENTPKDGSRQTARQRADVDKAFARILKLIAPRIRHFIRQYGLTAHWDDAEQCCAIAVHRAIQAYEPEKAQFTTFVNWQIRGELQSLRFRLMTDQRPSAKKVEATTVSLHAVTVGAEGEEASLESVLVDEDALDLTEAAASDYLARRATASLLDEFVKTNRRAALDQLRRQQPKRQLAKAIANGPRLKSACPGVDPVEIAKVEEKIARDREILERRVFGDAEASELGADAGITNERVRQISKRASRIMAELAEINPRFALMAEYGPTVAGKRAPANPPKAIPADILPDPALVHNLETRVVAVPVASSTPAQTPGSAMRMPQRGLRLVDKGDSLAA